MALPVPHHPGSRVSLPSTGGAGELLAANAKEARCSSWLCGLSNRVEPGQSKKNPGFAIYPPPSESLSALLEVTVYQNVVLRSQPQKNSANRVLFRKCSPGVPPTFIKSGWDVTFEKPLFDIRDAISKAQVGPISVAPLPVGANK